MLKKGSVGGDDGEVEVMRLGMIMLDVVVMMMMVVVVVV